MFMVVFDPKDHVYTNSDTGEKYISVTTLIGEYEPKFDAEYHATRISKRDGIPKEDILASWEQICTAATDKGTLIHNLLEEYVKTGDKPDKVPWLFSEFDRLIKENVSYVGKIHSEKILHSHDYKIAGMSDIIIDAGKYFHIADFKTNKRFTYFSRFNEHFFKPVEHLQVCEYNVYCLQLSMYAYMYEKISNKKLKSMFVLYLRPDKKSFEVIHMHYMKHEVEQLFENYKLNLLKK